MDQDLSDLSSATPPLLTVKSNKYQSFSGEFASANSRSGNRACFTFHSV